ncbi:MAG TPA: LCP family protein [Solirubrobacteraceae bacterium]|nr:LCP family protein [Solirubrobacteraceae bacterium]
MSIIPRTRRGTLWRALLAAVLVIGATAGTTAVAGLLQFKQLAADIGASPAIQGAPVDIPPPGNPQTILVIGSDHRAGQPYSDSRTDTMLLVRLNDASQTINVMSIPRDLQVTIPGSGVAKLNAAYAAGGPGLLIRTIRANVFPDLRVNHIVDVNFGGFQALVNAIGCVYADVDHRYYNNTLYTGYSSIDIQPGYQKLCGADALAFVRFRHTDSDIVRNARQQDFIRWAKDQYGVGNILANKDRLLHIFGAHTRTDRDLHTTDGLINLFNLVVNAAGTRIEQVKFPAILHACPPDCNVTADPVAEAAAFRRFMHVTTGGPAKAKAKAKTKIRAKKGAKLSAAGLVADTADGKAQENALASVGMPVYYPRLIMAGGGTGYCSDMTSLCPLEAPSPGSYPRAYRLRDRRGHPYPAYRMTLVLNSLLGQYYGVQGTTWQNPPLLASPLESKVVNGKTLEIYEQGGSITNVAWHTKQGVYWISNTLTTDISNRQMINIAASLTH